MTTHSSVLAWRIPGTGEPGGLLFMGSHRVGHDWSDLAAAAAAASSSLLPVLNVGSFLSFPFFSFKPASSRSLPSLISFTTMLFFFPYLQIHVSNLPIVHLPLYVLYDQRTKISLSIFSSHQFHCLCSLSWLVAASKLSQKCRHCFIFSPLFHSVMKSCPFLSNPFFHPLYGSWKSSRSWIIFLGLLQWFWIHHVFQVSLPPPLLLSTPCLSPI